MRFGTPDQFANLRQMLIESRYTEISICERRGQSNLREVEAAPCEDREIADGLDVLIRLLLHGLPVDQSKTGELLPPPLPAALRDFDLVAPLGPDYRATLMLHPWGSLYVTSDSVRVAGNRLPADFVFPALTPQTARFLASLPDEPCEQLLDLCSGAGIAALIAAAGYARHAWACDVVGRATQFAEFNRRLNNLSNLTALEGDLYQPMQGLTFDRIVAHPPYVPSLQPLPACLDGGPDGEQITRRILEGLSDHLRPGGRLYCSAMLSDRRGAPLEQRLRAMLGQSADEFDLIVFRREALTPLEYGLRLISLGQTAPAHVRQLQERFEQLDIERLVTCSFTACRPTRRSEL
jgi:SAM-dependent methyltransferase